MAGPGKQKVKWALDDPGELQEFESNDEILARNKHKMPPKGVARLRVVSIKKTETKAGDPALNCMFALADPKGAPAESWNGLVLFEWLNVTKQGAPFVKRFLRALGLEWGDFANNTKVDKLEDPPVITNIGNVAFDKGKDVYLWAVIKVGEDRDGQDRVEVGRFIPPRDEVPDDSDDADEAAEEMDDGMSTDETAEETSDESNDGGEPMTPNELAEQDVDYLVSRAKNNGRKGKEIKAAQALGKPKKVKKALIEMIVEDEDLPPF